MSKKTDWFPADIKPVHPGVYEVVGAFDLIYYSRWDGSAWFWISASAERAAMKDMVALKQERRWRGLAHQPQKVTR